MRHRPYDRRAGAFHCCDERRNQVIGSVSEQRFAASKVYRVQHWRLVVAHSVHIVR